MEACITQARTEIVASGSYISLIESGLTKIIDKNDICVSYYNVRLLFFISVKIDILLNR